MTQAPLCPLRLEQRVAKVLHEKHQMERVGGRRLETGDEVKVEVAGLLALSVDEQSSTADLSSEFSGRQLAAQPFRGLPAEAATLTRDLLSQGADSASWARSELRHQMRHG